MHPTPPVEGADRQAPWVPVVAGRGNRRQLIFVANVKMIDPLPLIIGPIRLRRYDEEDGAAPRTLVERVAGDSRRPVQRAVCRYFSLTPCAAMARSCLA